MTGSRRIHRRRPGWLDAPRALVRSLDVLLIGLIAFAVIQNLIGAAGAARGWWGLAAGIALVAVYLLGRRRLRSHERPVDDRGAAWWPEGAWLAALLALWALLLAAAPQALWVAFPMMLLQLHILGPRPGTLLVGLTVVLAVTEGLLRRESSEAWTGYVLGPVLGALVAIGFVLGLEAIVRESQEHARALRELTSARAHLAEAERERVTAQERERLAREIHDTLAQGFSAIELLLRASQDLPHGDPQRTELVGQARATAQQNLAEARRVVHALAPQDLERTTLTAALERIVGRTTAPGLAIHLHVTGEARPLPLPVETALVRITQSALANVLQHSGATRADVTLTVGPEAVMLDVVDNGVGLPSQEAPRSGGGYGLAAMRSRARELGGTLVVESGPGAGTAVALAVPLPTGPNATVTEERE